VDPEKIILGIDLGTTYSCVAYVDDTERAVVLNNAEGDQITPSVVYFETEDNIVIGKQAKAYAVLYKDLVVECIKREMGSADFTRNIWGRDYRPEEISALILRKIVKDAEQSLGLDAGSLRNVVITCPAYFGIPEREATKAAGVMAGLNVLRIINEPTAAAFNYGLTRTGEDMNILVYDLGGGTFDITLISRKDNDFQVRQTDGVRILGGKDWDLAITGFLADSYVEAFGEDGDHPLGDPETTQQMQLDAEDAKKYLTTGEKHTVQVSHAGNRHRVELTREKFEELTSHLLEQTIETTRRLLDRAREEAGIAEIDKLLLVGGSTRMPQVARRLQEEFGLEGEMFEPDLSVAKGAAIFGDLIRKGIVPLEEADREDGAPAFRPESPSVAADQMITVTDVASQSFGVEILNPERKLIVDHQIHNQDPLPIERSATYQTVDDGQTQVHVKIYQQAGELESEVLEHNKQIADGYLKLPPGLPRGEAVDVTFRLTADGRLKVVARHKTEILELEVEVDGVMSREEIQAAASYLQRKAVS
jgi:molecular chaperone DnaK